jgi:D-alanyl-D-alanine carboxypeptidase
VNRFQSTLDEWRLGAGVPVVAAAVRLNGSLTWNGVSLDRSVEGASEVSPRSRFCIYSITKTFTAVCVLRLDAEGLLGLDDPIRQWFADLPVPDTILVSHLLQHTSGLPDYGPLPEYHDAVRTRPSDPWTDQEFFDATLRKGLLFEPGNGWSYSNIGYLLLRRIIERATGKSFRQCVDDQIVSRLGLKDTFIAESIDDWASCVPGYSSDIRADRKTVDVRSTYHPGWCAPGVGVSNVNDVTQFYDRLFAGDLLDQDHLRQMLRLVQVDPPNVSPGCGFGILADLDGPFGPSYGHGGGGPGYSLVASILPRWPAGRLAVAVFCNSSEGAEAGSGEHALLKAATEASGDEEMARRLQ